MNINTEKVTKLQAKLVTDTDDRSEDKMTIDLTSLPELCDGSCFELVAACWTRFTATGQILQQTAVTNCTPTHRQS